MVSLHDLQRRNSAATPLPALVDGGGESGAKARFREAETSGTGEAHRKRRCSLRHQGGEMPTGWNEGFFGCFSWQGHRGRSRGVFVRDPSAGADCHGKLRLL